jgi:hypothetical protein
MDQYRGSSVERAGPMAPPVQDMSPLRQNVTLYFQVVANLNCFATVSLTTTPPSRLRSNGVFLIDGRKQTGAMMTRVENPTIVIEN